jgi:hypothetical protein
MGLTGWMVIQKVVPFRKALTSVQPNKAATSLGSARAMRSQSPSPMAL